MPSGISCCPVTRGRRKARKRSRTGRKAPITTFKRHSKVRRTNAQKAIFECFTCAKKRLGILSVQRVFNGKCSTCPKIGPIVRV